MACTGISDHGRDYITLLPGTIQRVYRPDGGCLLARPEPRLGDDSALHPSLEHDVVKAIPDHTRIDGEKLALVQPAHHFGPLGIRVDCGTIAVEQIGTGAPVQIFRRIVGGETFHGSLTECDGIEWETGRYATAAIGGKLAPIGAGPAAPPSHARTARCVPPSHPGASASAPPRNYPEAGAEREPHRVRE